MIKQLSVFCGLLIGAIILLQTESEAVWPFKRSPRPVKTSPAPDTSAQAAPYHTRVIPQEKCTETCSLGGCTSFPVQNPGVRKNCQLDCPDMMDVTCTPVIPSANCSQTCTHTACFKNPNHSANCQRDCPEVTACHDESFANNYANQQRTLKENELLKKYGLENFNYKNEPAAWGGRALTETEKSVIDRMTRQKLAHLVREWENDCKAAITQTEKKINQVHPQMKGKLVPGRIDKKMNDEKFIIQQLQDMAIKIGCYRMIIETGFPKSHYPQCSKLDVKDFISNDSHSDDSYNPFIKINLEYLAAKAYLIYKNCMNQGASSHTTVQTRLNNYDEIASGNKIIKRNCAADCSAKQCAINAFNRKKCYENCPPQFHKTCAKPREGGWRQCSFGCERNLTRCARDYEYYTKCREMCGRAKAPKCMQAGAQQEKLSNKAYFDTDKTMRKRYKFNPL